MVKEALVNADIDKGAAVVQALDSAKVKVAAAVWMFLDEYEDWRLVLSARQFDSPDPRDAYRLLHGILDAAGVDHRRTPIVLILPTADPLIRELRRTLGKTRAQEGARPGNQMIGGRFVHDAYVYRLS